MQLYFHVEALCYFLELLISFGCDDTDNDNNKGLCNGSIMLKDSVGSEHCDCQY